MNLMVKRAWCGKCMCAVDVRTGEQRLITYRCCDENCPECRVIMILQGNYARLAVRRTGKN